ncbi:hypothetical protein DFQ30_009014, partial [Apophysomyces sp. BC1015]
MDDEDEVNDLELQNEDEDEEEDDEEEDDDDADEEEETGSDEGTVYSEPTSISPLTPPLPTIRIS